MVAISGYGGNAQTIYTQTPRREIRGDGEVRWIRRLELTHARKHISLIVFQKACPLEVIGEILLPG